MELTLQEPMPGMNGLNWSLWCRNMAPGQGFRLIEAFDEANIEQLSIWEFHTDCSTISCHHAACGQCRSIGFEFSCQYSNPEGVGKIQKLAEAMAAKLGNCTVRMIAEPSLELRH